MVVLISIFAHNLSPTHSFKKQRIDSVHSSIRCTSAGCGRLVWTLFCLRLAHIRSFYLQCLRYQREVSLQELLGLCNGQVLSACCLPRGNPALRTRACADSRDTVCFSRDEPRGRPERTDCRCEQSKRKWIYKRLL